MEKKAIGIISGKGGVGKTSLTASLTSLASKDPNMKIIVLDCDVDAPNLALILPVENESSIEKKDIFTSLKASLLDEKCVHCKKCIDDHFCEFNALKWEEENSIPVIDYLACEGCNACKVLCPEHAFDINVVKSGEIISYKTRQGIPLIYGKTKLGSTTSGKLVSEEKKHLKTLDDYNKSNLILIDGPPGIGCPVIATVSELDYVIIICEPTPSGLHDMERALEVVQHFKIPFGIIINKSDLNSPFQEDFKNYIKKINYQILGRIPFDLSIPKAMSFARPVTEHSPNSKASLAIKEIYQKLIKELYN